MKLHKYLEETIDLLWKHRYVFSNGYRYHLFCLKNNVGYKEDPIEFNGWKKEYKQQLAEYIEHNRLRHRIEDDKLFSEYSCPIEFDYPDYGALPRRLCSKLDGDFVDAIQNAWPPTQYRTRDKFKKAVIDYAGMDMNRYFTRK